MSAWKSVAIIGSATLTAVMSSPTSNKLIEQMNSTRSFCGAGGSCGFIMIMNISPFGRRAHVTSRFVIGSTASDGITMRVGAARGAGALSVGELLVLGGARLGLIAVGVVTPW